MCWRLSSIYIFKNLKHMYFKVFQFFKCCRLTASFDIGSRGLLNPVFFASYPASWVKVLSTAGLPEFGQESRRSAKSYYSSAVHLLASPSPHAARRRVLPIDNLILKNKHTNKCCTSSSPASCRCSVSASCCPLSPCSGSCRATVAS